MDHPERFGKYPITGVLGKGAMGIVYKAFDPDIRRQVAVKTIRKELMEDDAKAGSMAARFRHEAQAAGRLSHPGIVGVYEYGEDQKYAYIAMEYVEGSSLREYFTRKVPFSEKDAISLMSQLLDALGHAHEQKVWHRDIKPANLIVTSTGRLKIADFGIARIESSQLTQHGLLMGTPGYMAPEQYMGTPADHRADLFAAGVVMYQLLTGDSPFSGAAEAVMFKICHEEPVPASKKDPARCWPHYDLLLATALAKKPERRFHSAAAFREAVLSAFARPVSNAISEETVISQVTRPMVGSEVVSARTASGATVPSTAPPPTTAAPSQWDASLLTQVETQLARYMGPVAKVMVRRAARDSTELAQLVETLAAELPTASDRQAFSGAVLGRGTVAATGVAARTTGTPAGAATALPAVTPEYAERATKLLTTHLGPIARVVVKRAGAQARDRGSFDALLAASVEDESSRAAFMQALARLI